jgi:hypothetical protein
LEQKQQKFAEKNCVPSFVQLFSNFNFDFHLIDKFSIERIFEKKLNLFSKFEIEKVQLMYLNSNTILFYQIGNNLMALRSFNEEKEILSKEIKISIQAISLSKKYG